MPVLISQGSYTAPMPSPAPYCPVKMPLSSKFRQITGLRLRRVINCQIKSPFQDKISKLHLRQKLIIPKRIRPEDEQI